MTLREIGATAMRGRPASSCPNDNPFAVPGPKPRSTCIIEPQFSELYAAAEFAAYWDLYLDTSLTITWSMLGVDDEDRLRIEFAGFTKCLRAWLAYQALPQAWIFVHERGRKRGLHSHLAIHVPGGHCAGGENLRRAFRKWVLRWVKGFAGKRVPYATRVRSNADADPLMHWMNFAYLMKGSDRQALVLSARNSPCGEEVYLPDLIAFPWQDPGALSCKRAGVARDLGPAQRTKGYPPCAEGLVRLDPRPSVDIHGSWPYRGSSIVANMGRIVPQPFRSKYEDGLRDVRQLYPADFVDVVRHGHGVLKLNANPGNGRSVHRP